MICVSVCAAKADEFIENIKRAAKVADVIELRFDCLEKDEIEIVLVQLNKLWQAESIPFLATFRPKEQGGGREISFSERREFWNSGNDILVNWADLELEVVDDSWYWLYEKRICSHHDFTGIPENLNEIYEKLKATEVDTLKIAIRANDVTDGLALMKLLERAKAEKRELIPIAMGESGVWTRILGLSRGAFMTFAALDEESATAPGQLTAEEMIEVYRVKELDENTEIYGLVAGSISHSVSPQMHNAAFKFHKMNAVYVPFAVKNLEEFMRRMVNPRTREIDWNYGGFSVTIPHKVEIIRYLTQVDETAAKIGAVNTVKIEGEQLLGFNTDAEGFIEPLRNSYGKLHGTKAAVLGAGGAARGGCYALAQAGVNVKVFARNTEKAKTLQNDFGVEIEQLSNTTSYKDFDFLINTTPLGMKKGGLEDETPAIADQLEGVGLVYDLVYNPFTTKLMREAQKVFVPTIGGLAMLVGQALAQQKIWTGKDAPMKQMSAAALRKLK